MTYELEFHKAALKEWEKLNSTTRKRFKKKLAERLENPKVPAAQLRDHPDRYKIKLHDAGYRLAYEVRDTELLTLVLAIRKRDKHAAYKATENR